MPRDRDKFAEDPIDRVDVTLVTASDPGSGSDGEVYLLLGGREFNLKRADINDREAGAVDRYLLGRGANIEHKAENDPGSCPSAWSGTAPSGCALSRWRPRTHPMPGS
jgi:hypothetical protein